MTFPFPFAFVVQRVLVYFRSKQTLPIPTKSFLKNAWKFVRPQSASRRSFSVSADLEHILCTWCLCFLTSRTLPKQYVAFSSVSPKMSHRGHLRLCPPPNTVVSIWFFPCLTSWGQNHLLWSFSLESVGLLSGFSQSSCLTPPPPGTSDLLKLISLSLPTASPWQPPFQCLTLWLDYFRYFYVGGKSTTWLSVTRLFHLA